jgi:hypothetical protein
MKQIPISTRDLKIWYVLDCMSADEIAVKINNTYGINCSGDDVVTLLRERKVQTRNIKRTEATFQFVDPDMVVEEACVTYSAEPSETEPADISTWQHAGIPQYVESDFSSASI